MRKIIKDTRLLLLCRFVIGFIFIFAGIEKIADPEAFAVSIENYRVMPVALINIVAIYLPWLELITGILLIFGIAVKENIAMINSMLVLFIVLILLAVLRGLDIDCGCFGTADGQKVGILKILENSGLLLAGVIVYFFDEHPISIVGR